MALSISVEPEQVIEFFDLATNVVIGNMKVTEKSGRRVRISLDMPDNIRINYDKQKFQPKPS